MPFLLVERFVWATEHGDRGSGMLPQYGSLAAAGRPGLMEQRALAEIGAANRGLHFPLDASWVRAALTGFSVCSYLRRQARALIS